VTVASWSVLDVNAGSVDWHAPVKLIVWTRAIVEKGTLLPAEADRSAR
jgi:hypothetical protein